MPAPRSRRILALASTSIFLAACAAQGPDLSVALDAVSMSPDATIFGPAADAAIEWQRLADRGVWT
ncbi:MAG: hypothetical protein SGJ09_00410 [Phycisphaerae bacterium]|nr:hypothetical protein [Phycisphaerae bacterium]